MTEGFSFSSDTNMNLAIEGKSEPEKESSGDPGSLFYLFKHTRFIQHEVGLNVSVVVC